MNFLFTSWSSSCFSSKLNNRVVYIAHGNFCHRIRSVDGQVTCTEVPELASTQEEADTKMMLHAKHASEQGYQNIIIKSSNTDVEVLSCFFQSQIQSTVFIRSGTRQRSRLISIPSIINHVGQDMCRALIGMHAFTGCDSVSAFSGKGKTKAFKLVTSEPSICNVLHRLGDDLSVPQELANELEECICKLYQSHSSCKDVNGIRYRFFCKMKSPQSHKLPPTKYS